jgi:hypothetical protein
VRGRYEAITRLTEDRILSGIRRRSTGDLVDDAKVGELERRLFTILSQRKKKKLTHIADFSGLPFPLCTLKLVLAESR